MKLITMLTAMCATMCVVAANISWSAPSSVRVGETFYVKAYYNGSLVSSIHVDASASTGKVWGWDAANQYKAAAAGSVTFFFQYDVGSQRYTSTKVVTIQGETQPTTPTLGSVNMSLSSSSAAPGDTVSCYLSAYSTTGASITSGSKSWRISSTTNDTISSAGVVTIAPAQVSRSISVTGSYTYNGVTKSATKTITVVPTITNVVVPTITNVTVQLETPWQGKVFVSYKVIGDIAAMAKEGGLITSLKVTATDHIANETYTATNLSGDTSLSAGMHSVVWDLAADRLSFGSSNVVFTVSCEKEPALYCVVDLSSGSSATNYPVAYLSEPPSGGFNTAEYKTVKLVLRRIEPGTFVMGADQLDETHRVTLTKPFYAGIFEMTQRQYQLVTGDSPCSSSSYGNGDSYPLHYVSYNMIRGSSAGTEWPSSSNVDSSSFLGKLRTRTGLEFDLPTAAQHEYACRAGTTTPYNSGVEVDGDYMWHADNSSSTTHVVGTRLPNGWGLYDMNGNVWEWSLDWSGTLPYGTDPVGEASGTKRLGCGGSWSYTPADCTSFMRYAYPPARETYRDSGFRLARTVSYADAFGDFCGGSSAAMNLSPWCRKTITVTYDANGGTGTMHDQTVLDGDDLLLASNTFVRVGYIFSGWSMSAKGDMKFFDGQTIETVDATLDGTVFYAVWKPYAPTITPSSDTTFVNASQTIILSSESEDVIILYTTDGSNPVENGIAYKGPFDVYESCKIRAIARNQPLQDSDEAIITLTRADSLSEAVNLFGNLIESDENKPWTVVTNVSRDGVSCVRSGAIGHNGTTWMQTSVRKAGTISFWWRASCEDVELEDGETYWYDYGSFLVDGVIKSQIAGNDTGWQFVSVDVSSGGKHTLRWEYTKDGVTSHSPDCIWIDQVQWVPADGSGHTLTTPDPVPYSWLSGYGLGLDSDFESAAKRSLGKRGGNGRMWQVWQDYVAGTDPTNVLSHFTATIELKDGVPVVTWEPNLNTNGVVRIYKVYGSETLANGGGWQYPTNSLHRFFKVKVEMP